MEEDAFEDYIPEEDIALEDVYLHPPTVEKETNTECNFYPEGARQLHRRYVLNMAYLIMYILVLGMPLESKQGYIIDNVGFLLFKVCYRNKYLINKNLKTLYGQTPPRLLVCFNRLIIIS